MQLIVSMIAATIFSLRIFLIASPAIFILGVWERYWPCHGRRPALASQIKGVLFQVVGLIVGIPLVVLISSWLPRFPTLWPALAFPLAFLIGDCLHYWEHRLEHTPLFWRFHAVHHSTEDLSAASNFTHFMHNVFMTLIYGIPVGLLTHDPLGVPWSASMSKPPTCTPRLSYRLAHFGGYSTIIGCTASTIPSTSGTGTAISERS